MSRLIYAEPGASLQQIGGQCPGGWVVMEGERPSSEHVATAAGQWVIDYAPAIAARRYEAEIAGITINGLPINTDDRSKLLINGAALEATIDPAYVMQWKTPDGFVELSGAQVIGIARAIRAHVQACFDREAELLAALEAGTLTGAMLDDGWP